jgi:hypothetical protein
LNIGTVRLIKFLVATILIVHIVGCLWYFMAKLDDLSPDTWVFRVDMVDSDNYSLFLVSIYWAFETLLTVGYGDITAYTNQELVFTICWIIVGSLFYTFAIGNLATVLTNIYTRDSMKINKLATVNEFCKEA